jgi:hypothetical protein
MSANVITKKTKLTETKFDLFSFKFFKVCFSYFLSLICSIIITDINNVYVCDFMDEKSENRRGKVGKNGFQVLQHPKNNNFHFRG